MDIRFMTKNIFSDLMTIFFLSVMVSGMRQAACQQTGNDKNLFYFSSINYCLPEYPSSLQRRITILKRAHGVTRIPVSFDVIGYYRQSGTKYFGGILKWSTDYYSAYRTSFQVEYYQVSGSVLYYFLRPEKMDKLFFRGDIGPVFLRLSSNDRGTEKLNVGWGVMIGFGYSFRIGKIALMPEYHYSHLFIMSENHRLNSIGCGVLY